MEKKSERIIVRLTKEEVEKLQEIAEIEDKSVSEVIRGLIKYRANHYEKNGVNVPVARATNNTKKHSNLNVDWLNIEPKKETTNQELYEKLISKIH